MAQGKAVRSRASREAILEAATRQFRAYGFQKTSMEMIAKAAGLSRPALYLRFAGKDEVLRAVAELAEARQESALSAAVAAAGPLGERLAGLLQAKLAVTLEAIGEGPHARELLAEGSRIVGGIVGQMARRFEHHLRSLLEGADEAGEITLERSGLAAEQAAEVMADFLHGLELRVGHEPTRSLRRRVDRAARLFTAAVSGDRRRR